MIPLAPLDHVCYMTCLDGPCVNAECVQRTLDIGEENVETQ